MIARPDGWTPRHEAEQQLRVYAVVIGHVPSGDEIRAQLDFLRGVCGELARLAGEADARARQKMLMANAGGGGD